MNMIFHKLRTDLRHHLYYLVVCMLAVMLAPLKPELAGASYFIALVFGVLAIHQVMMDDRFHASDDFWQTRPLSRAGMGMSKALVILIGIVLPLILITLWRWLNFGLTSGQIMRGLGYLIPCILAIAAALFALGSVSPSRSAFFFMLGLGFGISILSAGAASWIQRLFFPIDWSAGPVANIPLSLAWAMGLLLFTALMAWRLGGLKRAPWVGTACLAVGIAGFSFMLVWFPRAKHSLDLSTSPKAARLLQANDQVLGPKEQQLWHHFAVDHEKAGEFSVPVKLEWDFSGNRNEAFGPQIIDLDQTRLGIPEPGRVDFWPSAMSLFPQDATWKIDRHSFNRSFPVAQHLSSRELRAMRGHFSGTLSLANFRWLHEQLPLAKASTQRMPNGGFVRIQSIKESDDAITLDIVRAKPSMAISDEIDHEQIFHGGSSYDLRRLYVLYHESSKLAIAQRADHSRVFSPPFPWKALYQTRDRVEFAIPPLQRSLLGKPMKQWVAETRLHVLEAVVTNRSEVAFEQADYQMFRRPDREEVELATLEELDENATDAEIDAYLTSLTRAYSNNGSRQEWKAFETGLNKLTADQLDPLFARLPFGDERLHLVYRFLNKVVEERHRDRVLEVLKRDLAAVTLLEEREDWREAARPILFEWLARREPLPWGDGAATLAMAAPHAAPEQIPDLFWNFVNLHGNHRRAIDTLEDCEGFDLRAAVLEAWQRRHFGLGSINGLMSKAAQFGDAEALRMTVARLDNKAENLQERDRKRILDDLVEVVPFDGSDSETFVDWLVEYWQQLEWDATEGQYVIR